MKRKYLHIFVTISAIVVTFYSIVKANEAGAEYGVCGAPGDHVQGSCGTTGCHSITPITNSDALQITLIDPVTSQPVTSYQAKKKYLVKIELTYKTLKACGFESTVESKTTNGHIGVLAGITAQRSQLTFQNPNYATHINSLKTKNGYGMWEYNWTAPATGQGDIMIYAAGNSANNDEKEFGDTIFNTHQAFSFDPASGIDGNILTDANINVFPNPAKGNFSISYYLDKEENAVIELYNLNGQKEKTIQNGMATKGENKISADVAGLPAGVYFLRISAGNESATEKTDVGKVI